MKNNIIYLNQRKQSKHSSKTHNRIESLSTEKCKGKFIMPKEIFGNSYIEFEEDSLSGMIIW